MYCYISLTVRVANYCYFLYFPCILSSVIVQYSDLIANFYLFVSIAKLSNWNCTVNSVLWPIYICRIDYGTICTIKFEVASAYYNTIYFTSKKFRSFFRSFCIIRKYILNCIITFVSFLLYSFVSPIRIVFLYLICNIIFCILQIIYIKITTFVCRILLSIIYISASSWSGKTFIRAVVCKYSHAHA